MGRSFNKAVLAATASTLVLAGTAQAQEAADPDASSRRTLDVIEVTAERRANPIEVLHEDRLVEPEFGVQTRDLFRCRVLTEHIPGDVTEGR